jgi:hypothetical protein
MSKRPVDTDFDFYTFLAKLLDRTRTINAREAEAMITRVVEIGVYVVTIKSPAGSTVYRVAPAARLEEIESTCKHHGWPMVATKINKAEHDLFRARMPTDAEAYSSDLTPCDWEVAIYDKHGDATVVAVSSKFPPTEVMAAAGRGLTMAGVDRYACHYQIRPFPRGAWSGDRIDCERLANKLFKGVKKDGTVSFD